MNKSGKDNKFERYHRAVAFLEGLNNLPLSGDYLIDRNNPEVYIKRMRYFLDLLGNPDRGLNFIHIAGTSGKGSVTNMVHEILLAAGKKVGSFTSPHVVTPIEQIKVGALYISPLEFADIIDHLKPFIDQAYANGPFGRPSFFEIYLTIALEYFKRQKCQWVILEAGLGGRYDATNVIEKPVVTAITNIDYDHTEILGKTLKKIAFDKAGIIKSSAVFFTTEQNKSLLKLFAGICREKGVPINVLSKQTDYREYNRELATAIARHLNIDDKAIDMGIKNHHLMCRFETIQKKPLVILDGAHNRAKIAATVHNLQNLKFKKIFLIIGIADNKDHLAILEQIIPLADHIYFTRFQNKDRKCAHPKALQEKSSGFLKSGVAAKIMLDAESALDEALTLAGPDDLILVTGSFFLAGELRKRWVSEREVLEGRSVTF
jgi:dihydrofolate synthase/folylpolyglutamate synthase